MNKELLSKELSNLEEVGGQISHELAGKLVKNHHDKFSAEESLVFNVHKDTIEMILSQPGCVGICFSEGINEDGVKTLVYGGLNVKGKVIVEITAVDTNGKLGVQKGKLAVITGSAGSQVLPGHYSWFS